MYVDTRTNLFTPPKCILIIVLRHGVNLYLKSRVVEKTNNFGLFNGKRRLNVVLIRPLVYIHTCIYFTRPCFRLNAVCRRETVCTYRIELSPLPSQ